MSARRRLARLAAIGILVCGLGAPWHASAQQAEDESEREGSSRWGQQQRIDPNLANRPYPQPKTMERHGRALDHLLEERFDEAEQELNKLFFRRMNIVEQAMTHRLYAYIATGRGNLEEARRRFEGAIESGGFLPDEVAEARFQIAMLWMQEENWQKAADTLEVWFEEASEPNASSYYILALNYYQLDDYEKSLPPAIKAVELADEPKEGWLQLLLALRLVRTEYPEAVPVLEKLVSFYPKKTYWLSLSTVHGALGSYEKAALPLQLAYLDEALEKGEEIQRLAQMLMFLNLPYRAANVLEHELEQERVETNAEVLALLSNSWIAAREYAAAVPPLEQAAALSGDGELYVRLAQVHVQRENWEGAANALEKALEKGDLLEPGDAHLLMGIATYSQDQPERAQRWFRSAVGFETVAAEAKVWLNHIEQELSVAQGG